MEINVIRLVILNRFHDIDLQVVPLHMTVIPYRLGSSLFRQKMFCLKMLRPNAATPAWCLSSCVDTVIMMLFFYLPSTIHQQQGSGRGFLERNFWREIGHCHPNFPYRNFKTRHYVKLYRVVQRNPSATQSFRKNTLHTQLSFPRPLVPHSASAPPSGKARHLSPGFGVTNGFLTLLLYRGRI